MSFENITIRFSKSEVDRFTHTNPHLRYGQAFHQYMKLEKVTGSDKQFCDQLYNEPDEHAAKKMIESRIDYSQ